MSMSAGTKLHSLGCFTIIECLGEATNLILIYVFVFDELLVTSSLNVMFKLIS